MINMQQKAALIQNANPLSVPPFITEHMQMNKVATDIRSMTHSDASYGDILRMAIVKCQFTDETALRPSPRGQSWTVPDLLAFSRHQTYIYTVTLYHHGGALCAARKEESSCQREIFIQLYYTRRQSSHECSS